jgi:hypothetical protein
VNIDMTSERGYRSALSACPGPAAARVGARPAEPRLSGVGVVVRARLDGPTAAAQGTGLPVAASAQGTVPSFAGRIAADVPSMTLVQFVQPHPGDRALRPPV